MQFDHYKVLKTNHSSGSEAEANLDNQQVMNRFELDTNINLNDFSCNSFVNNPSQSDAPHLNNPNHSGTSLPDETAEIQQLQGFKCSEQDNKFQVFPMIDREQALTQLRLLGYQNDDVVYLRFLYPKDDPRYKEDLGRKLNGEYPNLPWEEMEAYQQDGRGAYFVVNGQGDCDKDVEQGFAFFCEDDKRPKEEQVSRWEVVGLPEPILQIDTGGKSIHSYWMLREPVKQESWRELQLDLVEFTDTDRQVKNPSRVMRLAGAWHIKPNREPIQTTIINETGKRYSYDELRAIIPEQPRPEKWVRKPVTEVKTSSDAIPLVQCLPKKDRRLLESGAASGSRNCDGFRLAACLIGTADYLDEIGQPYSQDPNELFEQFCERCNPPLAIGEANKIWNSASKSPKEPGLSPDYINNCINAYTKGRNKKMDKNQAKEEFQAELSEIYHETDEEEKERLIGLFCFKHRKPAATVNKLLAKRKQKEEAEKDSNYVVTADQIFNPSEEGKHYLVAGMVVQDGITIVAGDPKSGKTTLAYDLAYAVATGGVFLGVQIKQGKVLIFQIERPLANLRVKLPRRGFTPEMLGSTVRVLTKFSMEIFNKEVESFRPDYVLIDSLTAIQSGSGISERDKEYAEPLRLMQTAAERFNVGVVVIHHLSKNSDAVGVQQLRGSGDIAAAACGCLILKKVLKQDPINRKKFREDPEDLNRTLELTGLQDSGGTTLRIELNPENNSWINHGEDGISEEEATARLNMRQRVKLCLYQNHERGGLSGMELKELLNIHSQEESRTMYKALGRLEDSEELVSKPNPRKLSSRLYSLTKRIFVEMSTNLTTTYTQQGIQFVDTKNTVYKKVDNPEKLVDSPEKVSTKVSTNSNPYPVSDTVKLVDKKDREYKNISTVPEIFVNDWVRIICSGASFHYTVGQVVRLKEEVAGSQKLTLADVQLRTGKKIEAQLSWLVKISPPNDE
jgi:hypothetical protein